MPPWNHYFTRPHLSLLQHQEQNYTMANKGAYSAIEIDDDEVRKRRETADSVRQSATLDNQTGKNKHSDDSDNCP